MKVEQAIKRLAKILPIKNRLDSLDKASADIYLEIVKSFYDKGRAPSRAELSDLDPQAEKIVSKLAADDMITLDEEGSVKGCYPFTMESREHRIQINGAEVHAMCALDALAPSAMFHSPSVVLSECAVSKKPVRVELDNMTILNKDEVEQLHFGINWAAASSCGSCSDSLCTEMLFLNDSETAEGWMQQDPDNREVFGLEQAIDFSAGFFKPMMHQG
jgi:hypothetical protein